MRVSRDDSGRLSAATAVVITVLICVALGTVGFCLMNGTFVLQEGRSKSGRSEWKLDEFIVNLADRDEPRYLKVNLVLELAGKSRHGRPSGSEEARIRDAIITVLSAKRFSDLISEQGKAALKSEIKAGLNDVLEETEIINIYFTSFAMQ